MKNNITLLHCSIITLLKKYKCNDIELLISHAIHKNKEFILAHPEYKLSFWQYLKLRYYIYLRKKGYSFACITKHKEFYNLDFYINKHVLIPRPETEIMIDNVLKIMTDQNRLLIDVGTGSGCIPISILKNLNKPVITWAIDISQSALCVAKKNTKQHKVDIKFIHGDLLRPILKNNSLNNFNHLIITANLPYLTNKQFDQESSIQREPKKALVSDNKSGLNLYYTLLKQVNYIITNYKLHINCFLEINPSQSEQIKQLVTEHLPKARLIIKNDLAGLNRLVCLKI